MYFGIRLGDALFRRGWRRAAGFVYTVGIVGSGLSLLTIIFLGYRGLI
jgi:hypothetical protein